MAKTKEKCNKMKHLRVSICFRVNTEIFMEKLNCFSCFSQ